MTSEKITIFIPCYNRVKYIGLALESAVTQDYENKNIVVMDDCSNDGSYERLQELQNKWDFTLLRTDRPQRGTYWISNRIMEMFDTEYFQVLDSDDILLENATSKLMEFMKKESAEMVGGQYILIDENGNIFDNGLKKFWRPYNANFAYKIRRGQHLNRSGMILKKQVIGEIGKFNEDSICNMDYEFAVSALENNVVIRNMPFCVVKYRVHKDSLSNSDLFSKERADNLEYLKKRYPVYYRLDENYLDFFEQELSMVIDEKRIPVERWLVEYIDRLNKENKIKDIKRAIYLIKRCKYVECKAIILESLHKNYNKAAPPIKDKESYWNKKRIYASGFYQYAVYEYARDKILENNINSVLDVGCGVAHKLNRLIVPVCKDVTGIDLKDAVRINKSLFPKINFYVDNFEKPSLKLQKNFDIIICSDVIEHLVDPDKLIEYIKEFSHRKTIIIISTPERDIARAKSEETLPNGKHIREWNQIEFRRYLENRGFVIAESHIVDHCKFSFNILTLRIFIRMIVKGFKLNHTQLHLCRVSDRGRPL